MRRIDLIIVHCSATPGGRDVTVSDIDRWHRARGYNGVGYHWVVRLDGTVQAGRPETAADGRTPLDTRTPAQRDALLTLLRDLRRRYPGARIAGHRDFAAKACPSFDATAEYSAL